MTERSADGTHIGKDAWNTLLNERLTEFIPWIHAATVPVYRQVPQPAEHVGSAVLLTIASRVFAITAAHVIDDAHTGELYMGIGGHPARITGTRSTTKSPREGTRAGDNIDMGFIALDDRTASGVQRESCLSLGDLTPRGSSHPDDFHLIAGYPVTKQELRLTENQIEAPLYPLVAISMAPTDYSQRGFRPEVNLLLGFCKRDTWQSEKGRVTAPDLNGMSGCGTWWLRGYDSAVLPRPLLDAILIEWHRDSRRAILSTRVHSLIDELNRQYPETQPEIDMWHQSA